MTGSAPSMMIRSSSCTSAAALAASPLAASITR
jgi:hypothetical protein